jgi:hypothetical protein
MHCRLCINCFGTGERVCVWGGGVLHPLPPLPPLGDSITIDAKTTVHCSPDSSMFECQAIFAEP